MNRARRILLSLSVGVLVVALPVILYRVALGVAQASRPAPAPTGVITEDDPRWDCLRMGNVTCKIDGVLMTSIEDMPGVEVPYDRCLFLLAISARVSDFEYDASVCDAVAENLG